ncbi:MAG: hypothetical protein V1731_00920, partial [Candidatus Aenigmatarchaeota archaeon]
MLKGQSEVISAVLLGGVIVSLVGAAMMWGSPLVEKRTSAIEAQKNVAFLTDLYEKVKSISETCTGTCVESIDISIKGVFRAYNYEDFYYLPLRPDLVELNNNSITFLTPISRGIYADNRWVSLNAPNMYKVVNYGDEPGVVTVNAHKEGDTYVALYKIWFREVDTAKKGYRTELLQGLSLNATTGKIKISYVGKYIKPGQAFNGKDLEVTRIKID